MSWRPKLKAPYPFFGSKSKVASMIWERLGDPDNFIEPFCGSAAVLLARPHPPWIETINDYDCMVANFWRATSKDPEAVAEHADGPVNECDLHARHRHLVLSDAAAEFRQEMRTDPDYYDPKVAGWWCWGLCCWIGAGWCSDGAEWESRPRLTAKGQGTNEKGPGPSEKRPRLTGARTGDKYYGGSGVHSNDYAFTCDQRRAWLVDWFGRLRDRLRTVRVCCGHWLRVCDSPSVTTQLGLTGIYLDPPYRKRLADGSVNRFSEIYANDRHQDVDSLVDEVIAYCLERGGDSRMRIAVSCYEGEGYEVLMDHGWKVMSWKTSGGYGNRSSIGKANATRERIFFSTHCIDPEVGRSLLPFMNED